MKFIPIDIPGAMIVEPDVYPDDRGLFFEVHNLRKYADGGIAKPFVQDNLSRSKRNVLRGMHSQSRSPQGKLISVLNGEIFDVIVDLRRGSPTFRQWRGVTLSDANRRQFYVPEGCFHGFAVTSDIADVLYKCTTPYQPADEVGLLWNDPDIGVTWPLSAPLLSPKDARLPALAGIPEDRLHVFAGA